jgi:hypothetical protein
MTHYALLAGVFYPERDSACSAGAGPVLDSLIG